MANTLIPTACLNAPSMVVYLKMNERCLRGVNLSLSCKNSVFQRGLAVLEGARISGQTWGGGETPVVSSSAKLLRPLGLRVAPEPTLVTCRARMRVPVFPIEFDMESQFVSCGGERTNLPPKTKPAKDSYFLIHRVGTRSMWISFQRSSWEPRA